MRVLERYVSGVSRALEKNSHSCRKHFYTEARLLRLLPNLSTRPHPFSASDAPTPQTVIQGQGQQNKQPQKERCAKTGGEETGINMTPEVSMHVVTGVIKAVKLNESADATSRVLDHVRWQGGVWIESLSKQQQVQVRRDSTQIWSAPENTGFSLISQMKQFQRVFAFEKNFEERLYFRDEV